MYVHFLEGLPKLRPRFIFHGKPDGIVRAKEGVLYSKDITVEINETAYINEESVLQGIDQELTPVNEKGDNDFPSDDGRCHAS